MNKFCSQCGSSLQNANIKFCAQCGNSIAQQIDEKAETIIVTPKHPINTKSNNSIITNNINSNTGQSSMNFLTNNRKSEKKEAIEFCMNKFVSNRMVDIWLTIILTLGLAIIFFPILIWLIYRYIKAKKIIANMRVQMSLDQEFFNKVHAAKTINSLVLDFNGTSLEIPHVYFLFSKYSKDKLVSLINN
jgi:hypothetical protein